VCDDAGGGPSDILDAVEGLVRANLVHRQVDGARADRFSMLQTIREYAQERLVASGDAPAVRGRHATYFLALAEQAETAMDGGPDQYAWLARLEIEHDNLRAALQWFLERSEAEQFLRLAGALHHFWHAHAHFAEGRRWLDAALALSQDVSVAARMKGLRVAAGLAMIQADQVRAVAFAEECLALARSHHEPAQTMQALSILGMTAVQRGDSHQAARYLEECLSIAQAAGSTIGLASSLYNLGLARSEAGISQEALTPIGQALPLFRETGETFWVMNAIGSLGYIALSEGRHRQARPLLAEYLEMALQFQDRANMAAALEGLAAVAVHEESAEGAARLFALAEHLRQEIGGRLMSLRNRMLIECSISSARERLGEEAWLAAWNAGQAMTMEETVATALATDALSPIHQA
jgi:tetratricopeptide (TPR) repeat protein